MSQYLNLRKSFQVVFHFKQHSLNDNQSLTIFTYDDLLLLLNNNLGLKKLQTQINRLFYPLLLSVQHLLLLLLLVPRLLVAAHSLVFLWPSAQASPLRIRTR